MDNCPLKMAGRKKQALQSFKLCFCIVGIILLFSSMLTPIQSEFKSFYNNNSFYSSALPLHPQVNCRVTQTNFTEGIKYKRSTPLQLHFQSPLRYYLEYAHAQLIFSIRGIAGISGGEISQAYLLLDIPPPAFI
jgi:hypothetical protein